MVADLYPRMGFTHMDGGSGEQLFQCEVAKFVPLETRIKTVKVT